MTFTANTAAVRVLFVCTGNMCRSAAADRLLITRMSSTPGHVAVRSAGTRAASGRPIHFRTEAALARHRVGAGGFTSRRLHEDDVTWADLVLTMTSQHREEVLAVSPRGMRKSFTLLEAAALCTALPPPPSGRSAGRSGEALVGALVEIRQQYSRAHGPEFDIIDPIDGSDQLHEDVVDQIAAALDVIALRLRTEDRDATVRMPRLPPPPRPR